MDPIFTERSTPLGLELRGSLVTPDGRVLVCRHLVSYSAMERSATDLIRPEKESIIESLQRWSSFPTFGTLG